MSEVLPEYPAQPPTTVDAMLDTLFLRALEWEGLGIDAEGIPEHLAVCFGSDPDTGLEILHVLNWPMKRRVEIIRPTLDASDLEQITSPDGSVGFSYRVCMEDLFGRPFLMSDVDEEDDDDDISVKQAGYDVYSEKIIVWGMGVDTTFYCPLDKSSPEYPVVESHINHLIDLKTLTKDFDISPDSFVE